LPEKNTRMINHTQATSNTIQKTFHGVRGTSPSMEAIINRMRNPRAALQGLSLSFIYSTLSVCL
jgi:hypothetical protein